MQTLILGILHVFLKISLKKKDKGRGRHGRPRKICVLWMEKGVGKDEEGSWEPTPPASLWGRKESLGCSSYAKDGKCSQGSC